MRLTALEHAVSTRLTTPVLLTRAGPEASPELTDAERGQLERIEHERRRREWLRGRSALKELLVALSRNSDTAEISFPNARVSLTHSGSIALAAGTSAQTAGVGVDYERHRQINPGMVHWFLNDREVEWLQANTRREDQPLLLRLWTMKEAAFKCHPKNSSLLLKELAVVEPDSTLTDIVPASGDHRIRVGCWAYESGWLSIAVLPG